MGYITKGSALYIDKKELLDEVIACQANDNTMSQNLQKMMILLVDRVGTKFSYIKEEDREDCKGEALLHLFTNWHQFDIQKTENIFAYLTQIVMNGYHTGFVRMYPQYHSRKGGYIKGFISTNNVHTL